MSAIAAESLRILDGLESIDAREWDALAGGNPTLSHAFLDTLHRTGCATSTSGWKPQYLTLWSEGRLAGAVPLYLKSHSYGEYVFDWAWADAYERHGLDYYPKLLAAVPFTPATGPRLLARDAGVRRELARTLMEIARRSEVSSLHVLFPPEEDASELREAGMLERRGVQFHWRNDGYATFEDFLQRLSHDKRKKIRQERRRVEAADVSLRRVVGSAASKSDWDFFNRCYRRTYAEHRSTPYLTRAFFGMLAERMGDQLLLVIAEQDARPIAAALDLFTADVLYGRYWGSLEYVPGLHFETGEEGFTDRAVANPPVEDRLQESAAAAARLGYAPPIRVPGLRDGAVRYGPALINMLVRALAEHACQTVQIGRASCRERV